MAKQIDNILGENLLANDVQHVEQDHKPNFSPPRVKINFSFGFVKSWKFFVPAGILLVIIAVIAVPFFFLVQSANKLQVSAQEVSKAAKSQDLGQVKTALGKTKDDLVAFNRSLTPLAWIQVIPFVGNYWKDAHNASEGGLQAIEATELLIPTIDPYADLLGFKPSGAVKDAYSIDQSKYKEFNEPGAEGAKTAQERIDFLVASIPQVTPKLGDIGEKLANADKDFAQIDPKRYPEQIKGKPLRKSIEEIKELINSTKTLVVDGKPLLEAMPYLVGKDKERKYLVIFQNDKELRPTGGFMTAYSYITVKSGKIEPVSSDDIYNLDKRYKTSLKAPQPFVDHIKQPYSFNSGWRLRDMNWEPDFKTSMDLFLQEAKKAGLKDVDGVIAVDTNLLVDILQVTGQIGVPGYGNYTAEIDKRCNCPGVIYELESYADVEKPIVWDPNTGKIVYGKLVDNRKEILGPLVNSVLSNALAQPKTKFPDLVQAMLKNLQEKHVLMYVFDDKTQKGLESFGMAGRIKDYDGDYFTVVDANLGGRKSNMYVTQDITDHITTQGNDVIHNVKITYKNPEPQDGWLNSVLPNYMRVYVPSGVKLLDSSAPGKIEASDDLGKTVFSSFFELRPQGVVEVKLKYSVAKKSGYKLLVQTQPGKAPMQYSINYGRKSEDFQLAGDKELRFE